MAFGKKKKEQLQNGAVEEIHANGNCIISTEENTLLEETSGKQYIGSEEDFNPPDGGWGWVVCLASFWTNGTIFGILNTFGILYVQLLEDFDTGEDDEIAFKISWIGALQITMTFFLSPVASILVDRFGIRTTGFTGAFLATAGMLTSSFVHQVEVLYLTYGLLLGIGSSLIYNPSLVILGHYFKKHLGIVNGLVSFGSAVFTIILPFLLKETLMSIGRANTMRMLAAFLSLLMLGSLTWIPLFEVRHKELDHYLSTDSMYKSAKGCCAWAKKFLNVSIWKNRGYVIWAICLPVSFIGYFIPFVHLVRHTNLVMPGSKSEVLVMCIGATSGVSRLIFGKVADIPKVNRIRLQQAAFLILGVSTACIPLTNQFWLLVVLTLILGISDGCFICLLGPIAFDLLGPSGAAQGLGCMLGIASIPMTAGPPLAALTYDYLGSYDVAFYAAGVPPILAALLMFLIPVKKINEPKEITPEPKPVVLKKTHESRSMIAAYAAMSRENLDRAGLEEDYVYRSTEAIPGNKRKQSADVGLTHSTGSIYLNPTVKKADSMPSLVPNGKFNSRVKSPPRISPLANASDSSYA